MFETASIIIGFGPRYWTNDFLVRVEEQGAGFNPIKIQASFSGNLARV